MAYPIVHFEIPADDVARARAFYKKAFGWKISDPWNMGYFFVETRKAGEDGINGGLMQRKNPGQPFMNYINVKSIDSALGRVQRAGGAICMPKTEIGQGMGWIAAFQDTEGNFLGFHQAAKAAKAPAAKSRRRLGNPAKKSGKVSARSPLPLEAMTQRVAARATWENLNLSAKQRSGLKKIIAQVSQSATASHCALLVDPTGAVSAKAAQLLARELKAGLYRVDLTAVVSKYIGETEKNIDRLFETAATANAILLFDEADALFGKRTDVKDANDRYANLEFSYLSQKLNGYRGLVLMATTRKTNLDDAFIRRCKIVVAFPPPRAGTR